MIWSPTLILLGFAVGLLLLLVVSFASRPRVFSQYLRTMTGISVTPGEVRRIFHQRGRTGVRELFLELLIREDLREDGVAHPESRASRPVAFEIDAARKN
ncbi:MAG: hypothetical protein ABI639_00105 [Thermoanaerobaculia bacterium]